MKETAKTTTKRKPITVVVTVSKELGGIECAKYLLSVGVLKKTG